MRPSGLETILHRPARNVRGFSHGMSLRLLMKQLIDRLGDGRRIIERNKHAATVRQQFGRVPVWSGKNRLAGSKAVGQRATGD